MGTFVQEFAIRHIRHNGHLASLTAGTLAFPCSIGPAGISWNKKEGDGKTPAGRWPLRYVMYRPDRVLRPATALPVVPLTPKLGWCDDPGSSHYNSLVSLPFNASHEKMWRDDRLYDLVVVLGHNDAPPVAGKGSAVFMHLWRPDEGPTQGCIALSKRHLLHLLKIAAPETLDSVS